MLACVREHVCVCGNAGTTVCVLLFVCLALRRRLSIMHECDYLCVRVFACVTVDLRK